MQSGFNLCLDAIRRINSHGRSETGGVSRIAYTEEDRLARETLVEIMHETGFQVEIDEVGNIKGTRWGSRPSAPPVAVGSHIDTVPDGGEFDGILGVAAGLGAVLDVAERCPDHVNPLQVIVFSGEESSRFGVSNVGSKAVTGYMSLKDLFDHRDDQGMSIFKALRDFGLSPEKADRSRILPSDMKAFFELHIEQGPFLDQTGIDVGVVEAIAAPTRLSLEILGESAHSGACPMDMRKDALAASSEIILAVEKLAKEESAFKTVGTVGDCKVFPGVMNVVPGRCSLKVDIRGIDGKSIGRVFDGLLKEIERISASRNVEIKKKILSRGDPVVLDGRLRRLLGQVCEDMEIGWTDMPSGAGHDAMYVASVIPTAMVFVPCVGGISHSSEEKVEIGRIRPGYRVLAEALYRLVAKDR